MNKQSGLSMVELLVALAISSFLILGITQIYLDNKRNYLFQQGQSSNIENGRYTLLILDQELAKAGYRREPDSLTEFVFPVQDTESCAFNSGQVVKFLSATSFCIRYEPAFNGTRDCEGNNVVDIPDSPYTRYSGVPIVAKFEFDASSGELRCNNVAIADGLADLRFEFGVNTTDEKAVVQYKSAPGSSDEIRTVRYFALAASAAQLSDNRDSPAFKHWAAKYLAASEATDESPDSEGTPGESQVDIEAPDRKLYSLVGSTTSMRNRLP